MSPFDRRSGDVRMTRPIVWLTALGPFYLDNDGDDNSDENDTTTIISDNDTFFLLLRVVQALHVLYAPALMI